MMIKEVAKELRHLQVNWKLQVLHQVALIQGRVKIL
jgi:hypothetical protein